MAKNDKNAGETEFGHAAASKDCAGNQQFRFPDQPMAKWNQMDTASANPSDPVPRHKDDERLRHEEGHGPRSTRSST
jgi:hypothetical protein